MQVLYEKNTKKKKGHEQCWLFAGKQMKNILRINCHGVSTFLEYLYFRIQLRFFLQDLAFFNFLWLNIFQQKLWFFHKFIFNFFKKKIKIPLFFFCHPLSRLIAPPLRRLARNRLPIVRRARAQARLGHHMRRRRWPRRKHNPVPPRTVSRLPLHPEQILLVPVHQAPNLTALTRDKGPVVWHW